MRTGTQCFSFVGWLVLTGFWASPPLLWGQTLVTGRIVGNARPLAGATVTIDPGALQTTTIDSGRYRLVVPSPGITRVSVRAVGFYPASRRFVLAGADTVVVDFTLTPVPQTLDSITVKGHAVPPPGKMQGFEQRRQQGFGRFYTREYLAGREMFTLASVLRTTLNLQVIARPAGCGGFSVATGRSGAVRWERWMVCHGGNLQAACYSTIYLDGVLLWAPGTPGVGPPDINELKVVDVEGVEVYRSVAEAPLQYVPPGSTCGVVLLWTRVGGGRNGL